MFSSKSILRRGALALALITGMGGAAYAQTLVVRSVGPSAASYPAGKRIADDARITLQAGDTLTILDAKGTRTLRGPATIDLGAASATRTNTSLANLVSTQNRRRARTGAVRGDGQAPRPASIWNVDTTRSASMCVTSPDTVQLWRPRSDSPLTVTIRDSATGKTAQASFREGYQETSWPITALPISEGKRYTVSTPGNADVSVSFTLVATDLSDLPAVYETLEAKGCDTQRNHMLEAIAAAANNTN